VRWLPLLALAACYSPSYRDCEVTCASGSCPAGFHCDQGLCRNQTGPCGDGGIDGPADDVDSDGVLNVNDNCPNDSNTDQANEDGDEYGDVCDPCPPFGTMADNDDSDGDGVGNGCDTDPTSAGNRIEYFFGFSQTGVPPGGDATPGMWTFDGSGEATVTASAAGLASLVWPVPSTTGTVSTLVHFVPTVVPPPPLGMGVIDRYDTMAKGVQCWFNSSAAGTPISFKLMELNNTTPMAIVAQSMAASQTYSIDLTTRGTAYSCSEKAIPKISGSSTVSSTARWAGVVAKNVTARVQWVLIVTGP